MAKLPSNYSLGNITDPSQFMQYSSIMSTDITNAINGGLQFDQNIRSSTVDVEFATANTDLQVPHKLNQVPTGFLVANPSVASNVYMGSQAWTSSFIYLKASVACTAKVIVF